VPFHWLLLIFSTCIDGFILEEDQMPFFSWKTITKDVEGNETLPAGMSRQAITLGNIMIALHESFPNLTCKPHSHESTQLTYMLKGKLKMRIGDEERILVPGDFAYVPPNIEHRIASGDEYVLALDIFSPPRTDIERRLEALEKQHSTSNIEEKGGPMIK
jgi:mannose-6-phosphate isomerase-like protein (cupin superfamily)